MSSYKAFAYVYDFLMQDVDYDRWVDFLEEIFKKNKVKPKKILDLACGTGNITNRMAKKGYELLGVDLSEDMLSVASEKAEKEDLEIDYICQDISELEIEGSYDSVLCMCDGVNYIIDTKGLEKMFQGIYGLLEQDGVFIFDISTEYKFKNILDGYIGVENDEEVSYIWENRYIEEESLCEMDLTLFINEQGNLYKRYDEIHFQRAYTIEFLKDLLKKNGFSEVEVYDDLRLKAPKKTSERVYFVAAK